MSEEQTTARSGPAATPKSAAGEGSNPDPKQRLSAAEQLFWAEVRSPASTRRSLAVCYALLVAYAAGCLRAGDPVGPEFWRPINAALNDRLGLDSTNKVDRFRKLVWDISSAACDVREEAA